jgi:hypothetical protein
LINKKSVSNNADYCIEAEQPKELKDGVIADSSRYERWRYPQEFQKYPARAIWPGWEREKTINGLHEMFTFQGSSDFYEAIDRLQPDRKCIISHNLSLTRFYIGGPSAEDIDKIIRQLDVLYKCSVSPSDNCSTVLEKINCQLTTHRNLTLSI